MLEEKSVTNRNPTVVHCALWLSCRSRGGAVGLGCGIRGGWFTQLPSSDHVSPFDYVTTVHGMKQGEGSCCKDSMKKKNSQPTVCVGPLFCRSGVETQAAVWGTWYRPRQNQAAMFLRQLKHIQDRSECRIEVLGSLVPWADSSPELPWLPPEMTLPEVFQSTGVPLCTISAKSGGGWT